MNYLIANSTRQKFCLEKELLKISKKTPNCQNNIKKV